MTCETSAFSNKASSCSLLDVAAMNSLLFDASSTVCQVEAVHEALLWIMCTVYYILNFYLSFVDTRLAWHGAR